MPKPIKPTQKLIDFLRKSGFPSLAKSNMKELIGKTVQKILLTESVVTFLTNEGPCSYVVEGSCCSHSYFYEVVGADKILNKEIVSVEEIESDSPVLDDTCGRGTKYPQEVLKYAIKVSASPALTKITGDIEVEISQSMLIVFRNNSNGYYNGTCSPSDYHLTESDDDVVEVKDSWITE